MLLEDLLSLSNSFCMLIGREQRIAAGECPCSSNAPEDRDWNRQGRLEVRGEKNSHMSVNHLELNGKENRVNNGHDIDSNTLRPAA